MLYDFQDRKFEARENTDDEEPIAEVQEVECYLYRWMSMNYPCINTTGNLLFSFGNLC